MLNVLNDTDFNTLVTRWHVTVAEDISDVDKRMIDSLMKFNTIPGVVSIWSCSGHTLKEHEESGAPLEHYTERQSREIIFAINEQGWNAVKAFETYCLTMDKDDWGLVRPEISAFQLIWCFDENLSCDRLYPCWCVKMHYNNTTDPESKIAKIIHTQMEALWDEMITFMVNYCKTE